MTRRTDAHRPSAIVPTDYDYVAMELVKCEGLGDLEFIKAERAQIQRHMARTGGTYSKHTHGGNCHVCGAAAIYTALFHHIPTNTYVRTGTECAEKMEWDSGAGDAFRAKVKDVMQRKAGKEKDAAILAKADLSGAWWVFIAEPAETDRREEDIVRDIVAKLVQYGSISPAQTNFLRRLVDAITRRAEIDAQRAAEAASAAPVPVTEDRMRVTGKVLSVKRADALRGIFTTRMLVQHSAGWKVWGTLPASIDDINAGDHVDFFAKVKPSNKDTKFGFFSRPTKARKVS